MQEVSMDDTTGTFGSRKQCSDHQNQPINSNHHINTMTQQQQQDEPVEDHHHHHQYNTTTTTTDTSHNSTNHTMTTTTTNHNHNATTGNSGGAGAGAGNNCYYNGMYEMNASRDESEMGEEYFLPRVTHGNDDHLQHEQQQDVLALANDVSRSLDEDYSQSQYSVRTTTTTAITSPPPRIMTRIEAPHVVGTTTATITGTASLLLPRSSSNNSLVELLYGEEIVTSNNTTGPTTNIGVGILGSNSSSVQWSHQQQPPPSGLSGSTTVPHRQHQPIENSVPMEDTTTHQPQFQQQQQQQQTQLDGDELGSVSTNTVSVDDNNSNQNSNTNSRSNQYHPQSYYVAPTAAIVTTPERNVVDYNTTTPTTPTVTPPSLQHPLTLSPPQLRLRFDTDTTITDIDNNDNDDIATHHDADNIDNGPIVLQLQQSPPQEQLRNRLFYHNDQEQFVASPSMTIAGQNNNSNNVVSPRNTNNNNHLNSSNNSNNKKYLPPRAPHPHQQQYRNVIAVGNGINTNSIHNNSSSSSNNSSCSAMSSIPMTPSIVAPQQQQPPTTAATAAISNQNKQSQQKPRQQQQHCRALSAGDASILSALTTDSGDYCIETAITSPLNGITRTPNMYSSSRSYVGLPTFRDSNNSMRGGRSGTRSLSGTSVNNRMNQRREEQQHREKLLYSSPSIDNIDNGDNTMNNAATMSGMNIDIPSCLQQPILGDDDENQNNDNNNSFRDQRSNTTAVQTTQSNTIPPVISSSMDENDGILSRDVSPIMFHSVDANHSPDRVFVDGDRVSNDDGRERHRSVYLQHQKLPKVSEYETEAETAILAAIDEDNNKRASIVKNINAAIFPNLSRDDEEFLHSDEEKDRKLDSTRDCLPTVFSKWYALQHAGVEMNEGVQRKRVSQTYSVTAANCLTDCATSLFDKVQHRDSKTVSGSILKNRGSVVQRTDALPITDPNSTVDIVDEDRRGSDIAINAAENGERRNPTNKIVDTVKQLRHRAIDNVQRTIEERKADWIAFEACVIPQKETAFGYIKNLITFCIAPSLLLACILYYLYDNPTTGRAVEFPNNMPRKASISWWVIFLGVRHPLVWSLARGSEYILSNFLGTSSPRFMKLVGPRIGLVIAHGKGWPCVLLLYGFFCLQLLHGESTFVNHWLYWQSFLTIFTKANPAGDVTSREEYLRFLMMIVFVGLAVSVKRVWFGYYFGRRICVRYSKDLHDLLEKLLLLSEIATLSYAPSRIPVRTPFSNTSDVASQQSSDQNRRNSQDTIEEYDESPRRKFLNLLEEWDEPRHLGASVTHVSSLREILEFRQTVNLMQTDYPFSRLFGRADNRDACVVSASKVYDRLVEIQHGSTNLQFATLATVANDDNTQKEKMKRLISLFRPNKDNELTLLDFTRSVDSVYRELRTLSAGINNATAIDRVLELILNICFYAASFIVCLSILNVGVSSFVLAFSSSILALSFIIGSTSSALFEGVMMILVRRPYDIGDRIALSNVENDTDPGGSLGWIVEDIDIFYTTVRFGATREVATVSNGSLVGCRIINARRSDDAQLMIRLKFGIDTSSQQIKLFQRALEKFIADRPQEYHNTLGFRLNLVAADLGYIEYTIIVQCRSSWQKIGSVLDSRAKVNSFCLELKKQLNMRYVAPPMPINLNMPGQHGPNKNGARNDRGAASSVLPERRESVSTWHRGASRRDSDLVFSTKSEQETRSPSNDVEHIVAQLLAESKKDI